MAFLKLEQRYLNLSQVVSVVEVPYGVEVVTGYEVVRLTGPDARRVLQALERLADRAASRLELPEID